MRNLYHPQRALILSCIIAGFAMPAAVQAQSRGDYEDISGLPDTPAGNRVRELLEVVNANDAEKVRTLVNSAFSQKFREFAPMEEHIEVFGHPYQSTGGLDFHAIRHYKDPAPETEQ